MRGIFAWLTLIAALFAMYAWAPSAHAQARIAGVPLETCIARAGPDMTVRRAFTDPGAFDCRTPQREFGSGDFWIRSERLSDAVPADRPLHVRTASVWQDAATLYALYPDGKLVRSSADDRTLADSVQLGAVIERELPDRDMRPIRLVWHVEGAANVRGVILGARIATPQESASANLAMGALYAAFAGFALALLAHNVALWRALRQRFQVYYIAMLGLLMLYALSSSGALAWLGLDIRNTTRLRVNYVVLSLSAAAAIGFARHFFEPRIFAGWVGRAATAVCASLVASGVAYSTLAPWRIWWLDRIHALSFLGVVAIVVPILWRAWRLRSDYRWLFGVAWAAPIVLAAARIAHTLGGLGWSFWLDNSTLLAMAAEALISSMAIAYRVRLIAQERDAARAEEIAARLLADTDPLTGLNNRRAFLNAAIGRRGEQRLLILDIDHFKRVNDTIGHDGGDEVLRRIARLLRRHCPADGLAARLGGEEFALLAPVASAPDAQGVLAALRAERMPFDLHVTASIGACNGTLADEAHWKALYRAADRALFDAKNAGRDRARLSLAA